MQQHSIFILICRQNCIPSHQVSFGKIRVRASAAKQDTNILEGKKMLQADAPFILYQAREVLRVDEYDFGIYDFINVSQTTYFVRKRHVARSLTVMLPMRLP